MDTNTNSKTKTNTKTKTSVMNEIRELTDDELDAVNGGASEKDGCSNTFRIILGPFDSSPTGGSGVGKVSRKAGEWSFGSSQ